MGAIKITKVIDCIRDYYIPFGNGKSWCLSVQEASSAIGMLSPLLLYEEGGLPSRVPRAGSYLTLGKELSKEAHADEARDFIGKGHPGGEKEGEGPQENCSAMWLTVSGFMVIGLVSGLSLASHSDSESFLMAHASLSQDGC